MSNNQLPEEVMRMIEEMWWARNPQHETNADTGEDMFWRAVLCVFNDVLTNPSLMQAAGWVKQEWVSVQDSLPDPLVNDYEESPENCNSYLTMPHFRTLPYWNGIFHQWSYDYDDFIGAHDVTHWMPLPSPPNNNDTPTPTQPINH